MKQIQALGKPLTNYFKEEKVSFIICPYDIKMFSEKSTDSHFIYTFSTHTKRTFRNDLYLAFNFTLVYE